jgi:hypothetical protein
LGLVEQVQITLEFFGIAQIHFTNQFDTHTYYLICSRVLAWLG